MQAPSSPCDPDEAVDLPDDGAVRRRAMMDGALGAAHPTYEVDPASGMNAASAPGAVVVNASSDQPRSAASAELNVLLRVLGGLVGGLGVLSFVVLIGGTITYARFSAAGLPADEAVSDVPRDALLVLGAKTLIPFAALVLVTTLVLFTVERPGKKQLHYVRLRRTRLASITLMAILGIALHVALTVSTHARPPWWTYLVVFATAAVLAALVVLGVENRAFQWYVLATVLAAGFFAVTSELIRTYAQPTVRPVVVATTDGVGPIAGIYIAETSTQVLIGEVCTFPGYADDGDGASGFMQVVPWDHITAMVIGTNSAVSPGDRPGAGLVVQGGASRKHASRRTAPR